MVSVVKWQPTGGLVVQANRLGPEIGSHMALCCIHRMIRVNSQCFKHADRLDDTIKIILVLLLLLICLSAILCHNRSPVGGFTFLGWCWPCVSNYGVNQWTTRLLL